MSLELDNVISTGDPVAVLEAAFRAAIGDVLGDEHRDADPLIRPSQNPEFGDYQSNCAMSLAKLVGDKPRELAERIAAATAGPLEAIAEPPVVAGPGFVNIRLRPEALGRMLAAMDDARLGVELDCDPAPIALDLCGVNIAKQMHVGHLRSTIIGDTLARVLERQGRTVLRQNHLGDWGLTIAMVLHELRTTGTDLATLTLDSLDAAYRKAQASDDDTDAARQTLIELQQGDAELLRDWQRIIDVTMEAVYESFDLLSVKIGADANRPESFYRERLAGIVEDFTAAGLAKEDDGAIVVPFEDRERPLLIRKSDGGFLYSTTDLAAVRYRVQELGADRVIYVVDARQRDHFRDVFDAVRLIGWDRLPDGRQAELIHVPFGSILGPDRKPFKTRSGDNYPLSALLGEAIGRAEQEVRTRAAKAGAPTHGLPDDELRAIGKSVGIGAVKYSDLSNDLVRDYVFNLDRMLDFEGNTGPYMQYAHARVCSIFAKAAGDGDDGVLDATPLLLGVPAEKRIALMLLRYRVVVADVARSLEPHRLCTYLFELANAYSTFYESCPVLKAAEVAVRRSRLRLCRLVRRVLADGLDLLGIEAPTRM